MSSIAVIISVYSIDRADMVFACIESIRKQSLPPKEIIVVLDPKESLINFYKSTLGSDVKLLVSDTFGLSAARNKGIRTSTSEFIAFIDDDAVADPNWLLQITKSFSEAAVMGIGGKIIPIWPSGEPEWFPEELYWVVGCCYKGLPTEKAPIRNPIGCNMVFRRSVFEYVGLFSTNVGRVGNHLAGHDDTEFGIRILDKLPNSKILYDPQAMVYHQVSSNRVSIKYLLKRSYAEGFSKAFVARNYKRSHTALSTETTYLKTLVIALPNLLISRNVKMGLSRAVTLSVATTLVFLGYAAGLKTG